MKYLKIFLLAYVITFIFLLLLEVWARYAEVNFSISFLFYWIYLFMLLQVLYIWKLASEFSLKLAFVLTLCGMFFALLGISGLADIILRLGFVSWILGIIQSLLEYLKNNGKQKD